MAGATHLYSNFGPGGQFVTAGPQHNNTSSGNQFIAQNMSFHAAEEGLPSLLADLRITDPRDDKDRIEHTKGGLLRDSYRWILDNAEFQGWQNDAERRLLWVRGDPGKGKTMLLCGLIDELEGMGFEPVYFFCQATDARLNTATAVLRGLMYLLLLKMPSLIQYANDKHKYARKKLFEDVNSWTALRKIFIEMLHQRVQSLDNIILVIDALDECTTDLRELLDLLIVLSSTSTRVIVSSRNWPSIQQFMARAERQYPICLELNEDSVSAAVMSYTNHKVHQLTVLKGYDDTIRQEVQRYLATNANGTFLWVSLVTQRLADHRVSRRHTLARLREFPPGLDALYGQMLEQALNSFDANLCKEILAVVLVAFRPISLQELSTLTETHVEDGSLPEIIEECGSLLILKDNIVYFVHQSAKDFLLKNSLRNVMPLDVNYQHTLLFWKSLRAMSTTLRRNIYSLELFVSHTKEIRVPEPDPLEPVMYSCVHWVQHLSEGAALTDQELDRVHLFLKEHYLYWLEAMSLIDRMDDGISCIFKLNYLIQTLAGSLSLKHLVHDAFRFIRQFFSGIEKDPLQVYTVVAFAPARSIIRNLYQHEKPHWWSIQMSPPMDDEWSKCLQTIELNQSCSIESAIFSSDGKALALSVGMGIIQIRNADTGGWLHVLEAGLNDCSTLAASGSHILAAASKGSVFLFDMLTGEGLGKPIETGEDEVASLAFAPDGTVLATGSTEGALLLWDIQAQRFWRELQANGHEGSIESVVFSSNGLYVAAAVDNFVMVWDSGTDWDLRTFLGHEKKVVLVAFAPNNYHVQSASSDGTVKIWDLANSSCLRTISIPLGQWGTVAFSNDLTKVASITYVDPIELWDSSTGCLLGTLEHGGDVESLAFSPDDTMLMSATYGGGPVKLWDLTDDMESSLTPSSQEDQFIYSMAFSPDGTKLAVLTTSALRIWDANTGQCLRKLDEWKAPWGGASVIFGSDGILIARTSEGNSRVAEIWNVCTKTCLHSLADERVSTCRIEGLEFSPDNTTLAMLTNDTVSLWDVNEGSCRVIYKSPDPYFTSNDVKFSETGSHLYHNNWSDGEDAIRWEKQTATAPMGIEVAQLEPLHMSGYSIQDRKAWIKKDGEYIIWIPPEHRTSSYATWGSMMALGYGSGHVAFLRFK